MCLTSDIKNVLNICALRPGRVNAHCPVTQRYGVLVEGEIMTILNAYSQSLFTNNDVIQRFVKCKRL